MATPQCLPCSKIKIYEYFSCFFSNFIYFSWLKTSDKQFAVVYFTRISAIGVCVARAIFHSNWHPLGLVFTWANMRDLGGRYVTNTNRFHTSQHFFRNRKKQLFFLSSKHLGKIPRSLLARLVSTWERTLRKWDTFRNISLLTFHFGRDLDTTFACSK